MTRDVKLLLGASAFVLVGGLGWMVFGPSRGESVAPVLGFVDQGAPAPTRTPPPRPPFKLPWWK
jgi:hypothetical protein